MDYIAISFALVEWLGKSELIKTELIKIKNDNPNAVLINGFIPKGDIYKTEMVRDLSDFLNDTFPEQENFWNEAVDQFEWRTDMGEFAKEKEANVYIIGNIRGYVKLEEEIYRDKNVSIVYIEI